MCCAQRGQMAPPEKLNFQEKEKEKKGLTLSQI